MDKTPQLLEVLEQLHKAHPSWRFGQLVANISLAAKGLVSSAIWDVEDDEWLNAAQEHLIRLQSAAREPVKT